MSISKVASVAGNNVAALQVERQAAELLLTQLDAEIAAAQASAATAATRAEERQAAIGPARTQAQATVAPLVQAVQQLETALQHHIKADRHLQALGGGTLGILPHGLHQAIASTLSFWRFRHPQLLGLPPAPSSKEIATSEAKQEVARLEALIRQAQQSDPNHLGTGETLDNYTVALQQAKQRLALLLGKEQQPAAPAPAPELPEALQSRLATLRAEALKSARP